MTFLDKIINFLKNSRAELQKVTWPSRSLTFRFTTMVIVAILISMAIIAAFDYLLIKLVQLFVIR